MNRRTILAAAGAATAALAAPRILRAQGKELVVGGAASHKNFVETIIAPVVEKKYGCKIVYEGTRSLVNLEKMQKNKDKQYLSVVQMDDPVMIPAVAEGLLGKAHACQGAEHRCAQAGHDPHGRHVGATTCSPGSASPTTPRR